MIVITGAEGFIGSCLVSRLNASNYRDLVLVDDFGRVEGRETNLEGKTFSFKVERSQFFSWMDQHLLEIQFVFHIGARTDTTEQNEAIFREMNLDFSKALFKRCQQAGIPMVYASSAATYGAGELGYSDKVNQTHLLKPLNPYGRSKNDFDRWVLDQNDLTAYWVGLKFFNVYGPNEYHKGRMASVVYHAFQQIRDTGKVKLFQSHRKEYKDGEQMRDFIYVKDVCEVCMHLMLHRHQNGLFNLGSGMARTWNDLAKALFNAMNKPVAIEYIPIPEDIRETYQYFTEAKMDKMHEAGYSQNFSSLEEGIDDYIKHYLFTSSYY